jgi:hypothetical protein
MAGARVDNETGLVSRFVLIGSHDRTNPESSASDFRVDIPQAGSAIPRVVGVSVQAVGFPNVFDNVREGDNTLHLIYVNAGDATAVDREITVPPGYYSTEQLLEYLTAAFSDTNPAVVFELAYVASKPQVQISFSPPPVSDYDFEVSGPIADALGYKDRPIVTGIGAGVIQVADYIPALRGVAAVNVHSLAASGGAKAYDGDGQEIHLLTTIPVTVPYLGYQTTTLGEYAQPSLLFDDTNITSLDIRLRDQKGRRLLIGQNQEMYILLRFWVQS